MFALSERSYDVPEAIHGWLNPGNNFGLKLVFPKERAFQLATASKFPVLVVRSYAAPILALIAIRPTIRPKQRSIKEITLEQTYSFHLSPGLDMLTLSRNSDHMTWLWAAGGRPTDTW